jgi:ribosomal protein S18
MKDKIPVEKLCSLFDAFRENIVTLNEKESKKGISNDVLNDVISEIKNFLSDIRSNIQNENSWENNYLMIRIKEETSIGYQAMEKLKDIGLIRFDDGKHFDFRCETIGAIGSFFAYIKFKKPEILSEYVTHRGNPVSPITITNGGKIAPTKEWKIIEKILINSNLT